MEVQENYQLRNRFTFHYLHILVKNQNDFKIQWYNIPADHHIRILYTSIIYIKNQT